MRKISIGDFQVSEKQKEYIMDVLNSGRITEGKYVKKLERLMEEYLGVRNAILVTNGTVALQLLSSYFSYLFKRRMNVMVPAITFPATINSFIVTGQAVGMCDVGDDMLIDLDNLTEEDKESIDVIVPVHLLGYGADMEKIMEEKEKYDWIVVEDTAEAFGTKIKINGEEKFAGTIGDFGTFSFYVSHNVQGGELGMVVTNDDEAAKVLRSMKNHGRVGSNLEFNHKYIGSNYKTTEFTAAICYENMEHVDEILEKRRNNARYLFEHIKNKDVQLFHVDDYFSPLGYPIRCFTKPAKEELVKKLNDANIETRNIFPNLAVQESLHDYFNEFSFPIANQIDETVFYLPVHQFLTTEDLERMVKVINE